MLTETGVAAIAAPWLDPVSAVLLSDRTVFVSGAGSGRGSRECWQYRPVRHGSPTMPAPAYAAANYPYRLNGALLDGTLAVCSAHEAE
jgi:hypothetical protein